MTHPDAESLIQSFGITHHLIILQLDGLSHADSLLQPPFRGNCLNWVLGHILVGRNQVLNLLGDPPIWGEGEQQRYETGSAPITGEDPALPLVRLLADLDQSQQQISAALEQTSPEDLGAVVQFRGSERPLGQAIAGLHWHETYHTGQLELLRQLAGTNDAII
ncbi:DinB family protein [Chloroflexota bacterium]